MRRYLRKWWWPAAIVVCVIWLICRWSGCSPRTRATHDDGASACGSRVLAPESPAEPNIGFPTAQRDLWNTNDASVFMPTQSGRVESALYGSTRTRQSAGRVIAAFHEGIDIAPMRRDSAGRALDDVFAIADGVVGYANRTAGASSYGRYVVLEHEDAVGPIYSLYSHLNSVAEPVRDGASVARGSVVGCMGHSSTLGIPRSRAHLHFEVGLMLNRRFDAWLRKHKMDTRHGIYHGWNLAGIDPLALYTSTDHEQHFSMLKHLAGLPVAFEVALRGDRPLDYFDRYPPLWKGESPPGKAAVLSVSSGGVIVSGRSPTEDELGRLGRRRHATHVLRVDTVILGRNGPGLIATARGGWALTSKGKRWVEILLY
jgi:murein DD-endopeptidase MepM/ murein hydrolase activator NlpD